MNFFNSHSRRLLFTLIISMLSLTNIIAVDSITIYIFIYTIINVINIPKQHKPKHLTY